MGEKQKLLQEADEAYGELRQVVDDLDDTQMSRVWLGTWGVREIVIHISGWHEEMIPAFGRIGRGDSPYPDSISYDDVDAWNARFVAAKLGAKRPEILADLEVSYRDFVSAAAALSEEHFAEGATARGLFEGAGPRHYQEHIAQIRGWRDDAAR